MQQITRELLLKSRLKHLRDYNPAIKTTKMFCHPIKLAKIRKNAIFAFFQRWFNTFANDCIMFCYLYVSIPQNYLPVMLMFHHCRKV